MKRLAVCVLLVLALALTGCQQEGNDLPVTPTEPPVTTAAAPTTPPTAAPVYPFTGYVNASSLNVRPTPDTSGYAIGGLKFGEAVTIVGKEGDWYEIQFKDGTGYVSAQYIQEDVPTASNAASTPSTTADATATTVAVVSP